MDSPVNVQSVMNWFESWAPLTLAEAWDEVGLQVGDASQPVTNGLLCIDLTPAVVDEAIEQRVDLIIAYHPPMFRPASRLTTGPDMPWMQQSLVRLVRAGVAVYSPHTALDAARGGMNDWLCDGIGEGITRPIRPTLPTLQLHKVVVFVPVADQEKVRRAMTQAGAGGLGNYRGCAFTGIGQGGFTPMPGAQPSMGEIGKRESVEEARLEMLVSADVLDQVFNAIRQAHPYEEPAIDVFERLPQPMPDSKAPGAGRVLTLATPLNPEDVAKRVASRCGGGPVKTGRPVGRKDGTVRTVAVCVGSGGKLFEDVHADAYVTGEMQHHQALDLTQRGKLVILAGHTQTERPYLPVLRDRLETASHDPAHGLRSQWRLSAEDRPPLVIRE